MKKTITATIAALFLTTSLVGPAAAGNDLLRLGIGVGAALIGEAMKGGGNHRSGGREPGKGDTLLGPVGGKQQPTRQASGKSKPAKADDKAQWASYVPTTPPIPAAKPTDEEMVAWAAAAPEREAQEQQADAEMAEAPVVATDATTTAAVTARPSPAADVAAVPSAAPIEEATEEARDAEGHYWGKITPSQMEKARKLGNLGIPMSEAYRAVGLKGPIADPAAPTGRDLVDENGRLWGNVPEGVAEKVQKAIDLGMKPSDAIRVIAGLQDPDAAAAEAKAVADKTLAKCIKNELDWHHFKFGQMLGGPVKYTECRPFEAQIAEAVAKDAAETNAAEQAAVSACVEDYVNTGTYDCPFHEKEFRAAVAYLDADPSRRKALEQSMAAKETAKRDAEAQDQLNEVFANQPAPAAENKPAFSAPSAENQTAAAPSIDEGKTAAIDEAKPEAAKPVEQQPPAKKKMKLDL
ncbi:hypothetical protein AMC83_PA00040 (plasmid) [Rhizobium phaseoli]|uniref:hypothetical protein n=1 Tax=Rhizobium phaseoli TaxID=396 RepID=UPI0007EB489E|nr:hypothetical protein [Rhizobium phaseoli]ANL74267.1 hypothetical protein AMC83_PA00040 [Rhizobium phaseoli]